MHSSAVLLLSSCLAVAAFAGCKPSGAAKTAPDRNVGDQYLRSTLGAREHAKAVVGIAEIQKAIQMFQVQNGRFPRSLEELHASDFLPRQPEAPVGKRFAYDPATGKVTVADKK